MQHKNDKNTELVILEAAEKLFLEKGYALTSTTEIAQVAGCNQALVHYYFRTKDNLFEKVYENKMRLFASTLLQIGGQDLSFEEKLKRKIEAHFDIVKANPRLPFLIINELTTNPKRLAALKERIGELPKSVYKQFEDELKAEIKKGNIRKITTIDLMISLIALNASLFLAKPILMIIDGMNEEEFQKMTEHRKKENVQLILKSLRP
jgi:AcrR family transcriptional regulator